LSRLATAFVLGYHGCDQAIAQRAVAGDLELIHSKRDFDWLGPGAYFWESDPRRAWEWAAWKAKRGDYETPAVIGAVIDLRNCLDLVTRRDLELVKGAYESFIAQQTKAGLPVPQNKRLKGNRNMDRVLRFLDCAVINHLHSVIEKSGVIQPYDTVRGMFTEGEELYPGSGFNERSHVQIAVRNNDCIKGIFFAKALPELD
jgi:hypothetical protein